MRRLGINQSQWGDDRPLAAVGVSPCGGFVATGEGGREGGREGVREGGKGQRGAVGWVDVEEGGAWRGETERGRWRRAGR